MMPVMVKKADLDRIEVPEDYEVLDATALGRRLGFKRETVLAYLSRRNFRRVPRPNRLLAMGPIRYEKKRRIALNRSSYGTPPSTNATTLLICALGSGDFS
jgi:hypothetical protein